MTTEIRYFCPMRKVRVYLKKNYYLSRITRNKTLKIFRENTVYYLEGKITCKYYSILSQELLYQGNSYQIWKIERDILPVLLKFASGLYKSKSKDYISQVNFQLIDYLQKIHLSFLPSKDIKNDLGRLIINY